jgi:hypothetical protein
MFGKSLSEYLKLQLPILILITVVWGVRLGLSLAGVADGGARFASVTTTVALGALYYGWLLAKAGGSFKHLYAMCLIQGLYSQVLVAAAIALAISTGQDNLYTVPEYYPPSQGGAGPFPPDGKNWVHAIAHIVIPGFIVLPIGGWILGSLVMLALRRSSPKPA